MHKCMHNIGKRMLPSITVLLLLLFCSFFIFIRNSEQAIPIEFKQETIAGGTQYNLFFKSGQRSLLNPDILYVASHATILQYNQKTGDSITLMGCKDANSMDKCGNVDSITSKNDTLATSFYYPLSNFYVHEDLTSGEKIIYVCANKKIVKIDNYGYVSVFAGDFGVGDRGDGGLAVNAKFNSITSLWVDQNGIVYVSDMNDHRIRKIELDGTISTFAGADEIVSQYKLDGKANETVLTMPKKIVGMENYLYAIDEFSTFKIDLQTGWLTVICGREFGGNNFEENRSAINTTILNSSGISVTNDGIVLIAQARRIFKIRQGTISVLSDLTQSFKSDVYLFSENYVNDECLIGTVDLVSGAVNLVYNCEYGPLSNNVNGKNLRFKSISAMVFNETSRSLYIVDEISTKSQQINILNIDTNRVVKNPLFKQISNESCTVPGATTSAISITDSPLGLMIDNDKLMVSHSQGLKFYTQQFNMNTERNCMYAGSITSDRLFVNTDVKKIMLNNPMGVHCSPDTNNKIYIADTDNHRILEYDPSTLQVKLIAGTGEQGFGGDGGLAVHAQLSRPHSVYLDKDGFMVIADTGNHRIRIIEKNGTIHTLAGNGIAGFNSDFIDPTTAQLNSPKFAISTRAGILISDTNNHRVRIIPITKFGTIFTLIGTGVSGSKIVTYSPRATELNSPSGLEVIRIGTTDFALYIADTSNHRVLHVSYQYQTLQSVAQSEGIVSTFAGTTAPGYNGDGILAKYAMLFNPTSITLYKYNEFIITDTYNSRIRRVAVNGFIYSLVSNENGNDIRFPFGICSTRDPNPTFFDIFYFTESNKIQKMSVHALSQPVGGIGDGMGVYYSDIYPTRMAKTPTNELVILESNMNRIRLVNDSGIIRTIAGTGKFGYGGDGGRGSNAILGDPSGLAIHPITHEIYFSDSSNHRIRKLTKKSDYYEISTVVGSGVDGMEASTDLSTDPLQAKLSNPKAISFLSNGDLVIGDTLNNKIRIVSKGKIRTVLDYNYSILSDIQISKDNTIYMALYQSIMKLTPFCSDGYQLDSNRTECLAICFGIPENETLVCSGRGTCTSPNQCQCHDDYTGKQCEIPLCYGIAANESLVCSNNGTCKLPNSCSCSDGYYGSQCENAICFTKLIGESCGGSERGICISRNKCSCKGNFIGDECHLSSCSGISEKDPHVCHGRGVCKTTGDCECNFGYSGNNCQDEGQIIAFIVSFIAVLLLCIALVVAIAFFTSILVKKNRAQRKIIQVDLSLDERLIINSYHIEPIAHELKEDDFIIPLPKLGMDKPLKRLGEGGVGCVYQTMWSGMIVAVKVFDLNNVNISEEDFRVEAILLSKLRHPNIINFYGVSTSPTKRYIVMECLEQSLDKVIIRLESKTMSLPLVEKLKMLISITNGVEYLHNLKPRKIIHRDLKPQNILLDSNENCKVCDFGLSRLLSQGTKNSITNNIGSVFYMSPEMNDVQSIAPENATAVDIYSLSIIMWQLLFEVRDPYMSGIPSVLEKLGLETKPEYMSPYKLSRMVCEKKLRPIIPFDSLDSCEEWCEIFMEEESADFAIVYELTKIIKRCWEHDPKERPTIEELSQQLHSLQDELLEYNQ